MSCSFLLKIPGWCSFRPQSFLNSTYVSLRNMLDSMGIKGLRVVKEHGASMYRTGLLGTYCWRGFPEGDLNSSE
eukprot:scaffold312827_cov40-Prasinocladus_malaysianus.AAC.1